MLSMVISALLALSFNPAQASQPPVEADQIYKQGLGVTTLSSCLKGVQPGQALVIGEIHGQADIAAQHIQLLKTLREFGHTVSVGLEFFEYPKQAQVEAWRAGELPESEFLQQIGWKAGFAFDFYREQALFPKASHEFTLALNAPMSLTGKISKLGLESLSDADRALLPPQFTLGNAGYFKRFRQTMIDSGHLPSPEALDRYFAAQSTWDDTMAWQASEFLRTHPEQTLVIIVGEFHVQYGGGLPDRLKARGVSVTTFSQVNLKGLSEEQQLEALRPSSTDGPRADYVWTSNFPLDP